MRTDEMRATDDGPDGIGDASAVDQERAAMVVAGQIGRLVEAGRRISARPGMLPLVPSSCSHSKVTHLCRRQFPSDVSRQGPGLGNVHGDVKPTAVTTAQPTHRYDAFFVPQPLQLAGRRFIDGTIHAADEVLLRSKDDTRSGLARTRPGMALPNQVHHAPFSRSDFAHTQGNTSAPQKLADAQPPFPPHIRLAVPLATRRQSTPILPPPRPTATTISRPPHGRAAISCPTGTEIDMASMELLLRDSVINGMSPFPSPRRAGRH